MLKIKLLVSDKHHDEIEKELVCKGIEIDEDSDLVLTEKDLYIDHLIVRDEITGERVIVTTDEVITIESFGHDIAVNTLHGQFKTNERLYQLERLLDPECFFRISNSVIVAKSKIKSIKPTLSAKFILTMLNGQVVDVTRSYHGIFKDRLGI